VADEFDPYREALVMETDTIWPAELAAPAPALRHKIEEQLHADPSKASTIEYVRTHTGFCRTITVTKADLDRLT
jgi:hypothetical protein